ncbi:MAG: hypothetical protein GF308_13275 [Candidatus Heimdallarchaeota archaeon]|nr:hypothetical protein [Candidatus Heimdallarchaeota archaeon]
MNAEQKDQLIFFAGLIGTTLILAGVILSIDFLYAGIQEYFFENINPNYEPDLVLANKVIIGTSIAIVLGLLLYCLIVWLLVRPKRIRYQLEEERIIDENGSLDLQAFQVELSDSIKILKDLFAFLVVIILVSGLFFFLRFLWMATRYRSYNEFVIHHLLNNIPNVLLSLSIYIALAVMVSYLIITALQKYYRLGIISENYETAMERIRMNFDRLMAEIDEE